MEHPKKHIVTSALIGGALGLLLFGLFIFFNSPSDNLLQLKLHANNIENKLQTLAGIQTPIPDTKLVFFGDIMLARGVKTSVDKNYSGDYAGLFTELKSSVESADIAFANLEGPVSTRGRNVGSKFSFRFEPVVTEVLKDTGFDVLSVANNHAGDWTIDAFKDTLSYIGGSSMLAVGGGSTKAEAEIPKIIEKNGKKIGFLGFTDVGPNWLAATDTNPGILLASDPDFAGIISRAKAQVDTLIVSIHWGEEYNYNNHTSRQESIAHKAIDAGASLIVGHHPHVAEDIGYYKNGLIIYSLGNFIFDQYFSKDTMQGLTAEITLKADGTMIPSFHLIQMDKTYRPTITDIVPELKGITTTLPSFSVEDEAVKKVETVAKVPSVPAKCPEGQGELSDPLYSNVGPEFALEDDTYIPDDLTLLSTTLTTASGLCLRKDAAEHMTEMLIAAKKDNIVMKVSSAFRSKETQQYILNYAIAQKGLDAYKTIAKAGHSEHQLGLAVDLSGASIKFSSAVDLFGTSEEAAWLETNAYKYGYIRSYPKDKESITGYSYEPWHYRYVGVDYAKQIKDSGLTIKEFLAKINKTINQISKI